jgi:hypothetical protein
MIYQKADLCLVEPRCFQRKRRNSLRTAFESAVLVKFRGVIMSWIPGWDSVTGANAGSNFFFWASIGGLILLGICEVVSHRYSERKDYLAAQGQDATQRRHDEEMARLHLETATISERAAKSELEVARLSTPRVRLLTPEAVASVVEKLRPFGRTKFDIAHANVGREQWDFLWQLEPIFSKAGWIFADWVGLNVFGKINWTLQMHVYGLANVSNVSIELSPEGRDKLLPAANALVEALNEIGIVTRLEEPPISGVSGTTDAIHVLVGAKE